MAYPPSKVVSLAELARRVDDGAAVGLGGVFLHRGPFALVRELVRQGSRNLEIIKPSPGYDLDLLCRARAVRKVRAGIVAMEAGFGLAPWYRRAIERKEALLERSPAIFANEDFYDLCARGGIDLCYLGCAQVDAFGRTNVSAIGDWHNPRARLPGGGGAAVMMPTAKRVVTWRTEHSSRTLVEKLDFVTAAGNMSAVVTPLAVFAKRGERLALESWHPDTTLDEVKQRAGFAFDATHGGPTPMITASEREALAGLDPDGGFAREAAITPITAS